MGLFGWIKRSLGGGGGIGVKLAAPKSFTWADAELPLRVTLLGHKSEERSVSGFLFRLRDKVERDESDGGNAAMRRNDGERVDHTWEHSLLVELAPGAERIIEVTMPLPFDSEESTSLLGEEPTGGGLAGKLLGALRVGPPTDIRQYELSVRAAVDGAKSTANASRSIRYGSAWRSSFTVGGVKFEQ